MRAAPLIRLPALRPAPRRAGPALLAVAALTLGTALAATPAQAQRGDRSESGHHRHESRNYDRGHHGRGHHDNRGHARHSDHDRRSSVGFRITIGNTHRGHHDRGHYHRSHYTPPSGYYTRVWVPPVYGYRYLSCGTRARVVIRPGYYKRVWVQTGYSRGSHRY